MKMLWIIKGLLFAGILGYYMTMWQSEAMQQCRLTHSEDFCVTTYR